jgi:hypothetical protein
MRRLAFTAAAVAFLQSAGCTNDSEFSIRKSLGLGDDSPPNAVKTPAPKELPPASLEVAERVELVGRKVVAGNTFMGIEPLFSTVGVKESVLFHRGTEHLFISEGLVEKCKTDAELAAVLCSELGQMVSEKRTAKAVGRDVDPIPDSTHGAGPFPGGSAHDAGRMAELAFHEKQHPRGAARPDPIDAAKTARELLSGAGYSPAELDRVEPLLKQSDRGEKLKKQMGGSAPAPDWKK